MSAATVPPMCHCLLHLGGGRIVLGDEVTVAVEGANLVLTSPHTELALIIPPEGTAPHPRIGPVPLQPVVAALAGIPVPDPAALYAHGFSRTAQAPSRNPR